jgi:CDP-diacylglycerol--glycerol-3-phosphate 3-phosphatidyltransferase
VLRLSIASLLFCTTILGMYLLRVVRDGRARAERLGPAPGSALAPGRVVEAFYWALQAPGRWLARLGVDPDVLTYCALACSLASLPLIASGAMVEGGLCVAVGGAFDALDGLVARLRGRASAAGAVLDSVLDRLADAAPFAGLAVFYRGSAAALLVALAALTASSLVSYARARADVHQLHLPDGVMRRHERIAYLVLSLVLAPLLPRAEILGSVPYPATLAGVAFIAAGGFFAALVLVARIRTALAPAPSRLAAERPPSATPASPLARTTPLMAENSRSPPGAC